MSVQLSVLVDGVEVPVVPEHPGINVEAAIGAKPFKDWISKLDKKLKISKITIQSLDMFGPRVGFIKFKADATFNGKIVPGIVFMRGGAVAILVVLSYQGQKFVVCTKQPRVPIGCSDYLEIPAGMLDDSNHFVGVAAKELKEETGIELDESNLYDLTEKTYGSSGIFPSPGGCDEFIRLMVHERDVSKSELDDLQGKLTGAIEENEQITLELVKYDELWRVCRDVKAHSAMLLYEKLISSGVKFT